MLLCRLFRDLQKATKNFTTILGHGSFGLVYKAVMATGEVMAEKVLVTPLLLGARRTQGIGCRPCSPGGPLVMRSLGREFVTAAEEQVGELYLLFLVSP